MPYKVQKSASCSDSKPWAVIKESDGMVMGCHPTKAAAQQQIKALYANTNAAPPMAEQERRALAGTVELRSAENQIGTIVGYAAVFNQETMIGSDLFGWREQIAPTAFDQAIETDDVRALFNHDPNLLLGRTTNETLRLSVDKTGLKYEIDLPDTRAAQDVRELIRRGDVNGSSFGFIVEADTWDESAVKKGKLPLRTIEKVALYDVSPVTYPAYPQTSVSARSKAQAAQEAAASAEATAKENIPAEILAAREAVEEAKRWQPSA